MKKVTVSYSWKEEKSTAHAGRVEAFCEKLREAGAEVVRDVDHLKPGECISQFMNSVGASDLLCIFLTDSYLRSPNCMYELLVAWDKSKDRPDELRSRIKVWQMGVDLYDTAGRLEYTRYWKAERDRLKTLIEDNATDGLAPGELQSFRRIKDFAEKVNEMLLFVADTLAPRDEGEFTEWIIAHLGNGGDRVETDEEKLRQVHENTVQEMERLVNGNKTLFDFLDNSAPGLVHRESTKCVLCKASKDGGCDFCRFLKQIRDGLHEYSATSSDWNDLEAFTGGLAVLAVDPQWILAQRDLLLKGSIHYPALDDFVPIGGGQRANFLHLVLAALAGGRARLSKIFGEPALDERRLPDLPGVPRGTLETDRNSDIKLHFVRFILGPDVNIDSNDQKRIDLLFSRVKDILRFALIEERDPYFGTGESYRRLSDEVRGKLELHDFLLIQPSGDGSEDEIVNDPIFFLKYLNDIFSKIEAQRQLQS